MTQQRISDFPTLDELRKLVEKATPGPWGVLPPDENGEIAIAGNRLGGGYLVTYAFPNGDDCRDFNAELIALAPALAARVIELSDQLAAKDARIAELEEQLRECADAHRVKSRPRT